MLDWQVVFYAIVSLAFTIGGYLYRELKAKADKTHEEFLIYKTQVAEKYVSNDKLTETVTALSKNVENVAAGVLRIESRINSQIDSRSHP